MFYIANIYFKEQRYKKKNAEIIRLCHFSFPSAWVSKLQQVNYPALRCFLRVPVPWALSLRDEASNPKAKHKSPTVPVQVPTTYLGMGGTWDGTRDMRDGNNGLECVLVKIP